MTIYHPITQRTCKLCPTCFNSRPSDNDFICAFCLHDFNDPNQDLDSCSWYEPLDEGIPHGSN